jgi:hypothetical protein
MLESYGKALRRVRKKLIDRDETHCASLEVDYRISELEYELC